MFSERRAPDEAALRGLHRNRPRQPRLEGMSLLIHVVAIQVHAGLEPKRVARAEAARCNTGGIQLAPDAHGILRGNHDFEAVLAGVAGAGDEPVVDFATEEWTECQGRIRAGR